MNWSFENVLALVNGVSAFVLLSITGVSMLVALRSAKAAQRSAIIAERALTEMERPYVVLDSRNMEGVSLGDENQLLFASSLKFSFINHGRSPAILTAICFEPAESWQVGGELPSVLKVDASKASPLPSGVAIAAGGSLSWKAPFNSMDFAIRPTDGKGPHLYHRGFLLYSDLLGAKFVTGFCVLWHRGEFVLAGDEAHNYVRKID